MIKMLLTAVAAFALAGPARAAVTVAYGYGDFAKNNTVSSGVIRNSNLEPGGRSFIESGITMAVINETGRIIVTRINEPITMNSYLNVRFLDSQLAFFAFGSFGLQFETLAGLQALYVNGEAAALPRYSSGFLGFVSDDAAAPTVVTMELSQVAQVGIMDVTAAYTATAAPPAPEPPAAVPEPAGWAMMIVGFGMTGSALRRRRRPAIRFG